MRENNIMLVCFLCLVTMLHFSCRNEDNPEIVQDKPVALSVFLEGISESEDSTEITRSGSEAPVLQAITVPVDSGMTLEATLERITPAPTRGVIPMSVGVKYRVIVFKQNDISASGYISYADYVVGITGAVAGNLHAPLGAAVTFVCYSLNTATLSAFNQSSLYVAANPAADDLLYVKFNQTITAGNSTVSFAFKHQFSQVTVIADATSMSRNISAISTSLSPNYSASLNLSTASLSATSGAARTIPWGAFAAGQVIASIPCTVYTAGNNSVTINIYSLTIGGVTKGNFATTFGGIMQGGTRYTLRLRFKASYEGPIVAGRTWAPGNLIKSGSSYIFASVQEYCTYTWNGGDYWNWCMLDPTQNTSSASSYNYATNDPCRLVTPANTWRMPTKSDLEALIASGSVWAYRNGYYGRYFGTTNAATGNANPSNYVFLPVAGFRNYSSQSVGYGGASGWYWSCSLNNSYSAYYMFFGTASPGVPTGDKNIGFSIRCVK